MCRNITTLRGLEPAATSEEIEAAARQYVRKVSGVQTLSPRTEAAFEQAVRAVTEATRELLAELPPRSQAAHAAAAAADRGTQNGRLREPAGPPRNQVRVRGPGW